MIAPLIVGGSIVKYYGLSVVAYFTANSCLYLEFVTGRQTEFNLVQYLTRNPAAFRNARYGCKTHVRESACFRQDGADRVIFAVLDRLRGQFIRHEAVLLS